jgi:5-methylthioadenosine/S-adenosylhomocysteine deaminase
MPSLLLQGGFICAGGPESWIADGAVLIEGTAIRWVGPSGAVTGLPAGTARRDLGGQVVIPGLVNTHAHGGMSLQRGCCDDGDLFQWAAALAPHTGTLTLADNRWGCWLAVMEMVRNGITTACDCTRYGAGIFAEVASAVGMRSLSGALANSPSLRRSGRPNWPLALEETRAAMLRHQGNDRVRFYLGAHSPYSCTDDLLREVKAEARALDLPFVIHVAENRAEHAMLAARGGASPVRHLRDLGLLDARSLLAHCVWVDDEEIAILAGSGAAVAHNPVSNAKLGSGVAPVPALRRPGVPVGLGTDGTLSNNALSIFQEMKLAVLLQRVVSLDGHAMTAADAFAMATAEGARALGLGRQVGTLAAGMQADLTVLALSHPLGLTAGRVLSDLVYAAGPQHVRTVMVAGETILDDGRFTRFDEAAVHAEIGRIYGATGATGVR